jgi:hypothetical protein
MSRRLTSCRITSRHVTSRHVTSRHVTSRHVTSRHVTSRYYASNNPFDPSMRLGLIGVAQFPTPLSSCQPVLLLRYDSRVNQLPRGSAHPPPLSPPQHTPHPLTHIRWVPLPADHFLFAAPSLTYPPSASLLPPNGNLFSDFLSSSTTPYLGIPPPPPFPSSPHTPATRSWLLRKSSRIVMDLVGGAVEGGDVIWGEVVWIGVRPWQHAHHPRSPLLCKAGSPRLRHLQAGGGGLWKRAQRQEIPLPQRPPLKHSKVY